MGKKLTIYLPEEIFNTIEELKKKRNDPTRSDTIRVLILSALAEMGFLPEDQRRAIRLPMGVGR